MSKRESYTAGTFNWVDLMAHDMKAAGEFYADLFGWEVEDQDTDGGPPYAQFKKDGQIIAGMGQTSEEMKAQGVPPMWNSYVAVDDAEAVAKRVVELGGNVVFPVMKVMDAGTMAFVTDAEGAMFGIWQAERHIGATLVSEPGAFCWNELNTRDVEKAKGFYGELFGWEFQDVPHPMTTMSAFKNGDVDNGTLFRMTEEMKGIPPVWIVYFAVENCDATVARLVEKGGQVHMPAMDIGPGRFAVVADPWGAVFNVMQLSETN